MLIKLTTEDILLIIAEFFLIALTATVWKRKCRLRQAKHSINNFLVVVVSYAGYHAADIPPGAMNLEQVLLVSPSTPGAYN